MYSVFHRKDVEDWVSRAPYFQVLDIESVDESLESGDS